MRQNQLDFFRNVIWDVWNTYSLGTVKEIARKAGVTPQTVRNFKNGKSFPYKVLLYMVSTILWELELNSWHMANKAGVTEREVQSDRAEIMTILSTLGGK